MAAGRFASIDIGSNTTLLLVADVDSKGVARTVHEEQASNGIGKDVFAQGVVSSETIKNNVDIIESMMGHAGNLNAVKMKIVGTSALRQTGNAGEFCAAVKKQTGEEVIILSGAEEAELLLKGYFTSGRRLPYKVLLVDIGGGSTEFTFSQRGQAALSRSVDIGAVRLLRDAGLGEPPALERYNDLCEIVNKCLEKSDVTKFKTEATVFSGGTATALAGLKRRLISYDGNSVEGTTLELKWIKRIQERFLVEDLTGRRKMLGFDPDRAEVIIYGTEIMISIMRILDISQVEITNRGLRYGLLGLL